MTIVLCPYCGDEYPKKLARDDNNRTERYYCIPCGLSFDVLDETTAGGYQWSRLLRKDE